MNLGQTLERLLELSTPGAIPGRCLNCIASLRLALADIASNPKLDRNVEFSGEQLAAEKAALKAAYPDAKDCPDCDARIRACRGGSGIMSRVTTIHCSRCGSTILGGHSILTVTAGELANRVEEPYFDLCQTCTDRFLDWLRQGQPNALAGVGAAAVNVLGILACLVR